MKRRAGSATALVDCGGSVDAPENGRRKNRLTRNEQRLGGKGLSLRSFINAKSYPSGYNPALVKKLREFYKNAKFVNKYRKSLKQQSQPKDSAAMSSEVKMITEQDKDNIERKPKGAYKKIKKTSLKIIREEYEKKHAEEEKARMEREAIMQAKKKARAEAEAKRKAL